MDDRWDQWHKSRFQTRHKSAAMRPGFALPMNHECRVVHDACIRGGIVGMIGPRGTGKTQIATCAAGHALLGHGRSIDYWRAADLFGDFKANCYGGELGESAWMVRMRSPRVLVIDELQDRGDTSTEDRILTRLIDHRYGEPDRATVLIANLDPEAFMSSLGPSVTDRLVETGFVLVFDGNSMRSPKEKA